MKQTILSLETLGFSPINCADPFQIEIKSCLAVSKLSNSAVGYDSERNECREITKQTYVCNSQMSALFNSFEECTKCVQRSDGVSESQKQAITCFDNPCTDLCVSNIYKINCFVPPCPQYRCVTSDQINGSVKH